MVLYFSLAAASENSGSTSLTVAAMVAVKSLRLKAAIISVFNFS